MAYRVFVKKRVLKNLSKLLTDVQQRFKTLIAVLMQSGTAPGWRNFSKLGGNRYHCHLTYHYVACWTCEKETVTIEVYYAGSRENAPY
jgi:mRNA-degrading endonuclease RelE of RelBE toxin-antitoxin system